MGILEYVIGLRRKPRNNNIIFLGLDNAGKTTILRILTGETIATAAVPTQGFLIKTIKVGGVKLQVFDVGGQTHCRPYWRQYYSEAAGAVFVLDASNHSRLHEAYEAIDLLFEEDKLVKAPVLIFANKQDRMESVSPEEVIKHLIPPKRECPWRVQGCSAVTGDGINEGMQWLLREMCMS